jgi:hypothetical protein
VRVRQRLSVLASLSLLAGSLVVLPAAPAVAASGVARSITLAGTSSPVTGAFQPSGDGSQVEFPAQEAEAEMPAFDGTIVDRSLSAGTGTGASVASGPKAKSDPTFKTGFEGLDLYQQRYARGGNQYTVEPPDQGLCVGNGYVVEAVNDVFNVYDEAGSSLLPDNTATNIVSGLPRDVDHAVDLNSFYGYPPAIDRTTGVAGEFVTDPSCLYDAATNRFFVAVLTLDRTPGGAYTGGNHIDIAVSKTGDPTGQWNIYKLDVTWDGTDTGGVNPGPYLGDYPHIGADANGFYVTTNAYPWCCNGFAGAQIYALSKRQLAGGAADVTMVHIDTSGMVPVPSTAGPTQPGFTVWPAQSSGAASGDAEFFMSSNAAAEARDPVNGTNSDYVSDQLVVWTLKHTGSLDSRSPSLSLSTRVLPVETYAIPPKAQQPGSGALATAAAPQGYCINDTTTVTVAGSGCWRLLFTNEPAHNEVVSTPDANDTRMQQVTYANGMLWGALDTAIDPDGGATRAGIAYFIVNPNAGKVVKQGYLGATGYDFTYPAIGVTQSGRGVMAFTAMGDDTYPSAAYAAIDAIVGVSSWNIVPGGEGAAVDDGFTSYKSQVGNPPRTRWGDYGAAAVDGNVVWIASEYVSTACDYTTWGGPYFAGGTGDNLLGTCAGSPGAPGGRTALGNWSTYISKFVP